jgi:hypothetical protein
MGGSIESLSYRREIEGSFSADAPRPKGRYAALPPQPNEIRAGDQSQNSVPLLATADEVIE